MVFPTAERRKTETDTYTVYGDDTNIVRATKDKEEDSATENTARAGSAENDMV